MKRPRGFDEGEQPAAIPPTTPVADRAFVSETVTEASTEAEVAAAKQPAVASEREHDAPLDSAELGQAVNAADQVRQELSEQSRKAKEALDALKAAQRDRKARERAERRRFTRSLRERRRPWLIAGGAILALITLVTVSIFSPLMHLKNITVIGANRVDVAALTASLESQIGTPLALLDRNLVAQSLEKFPAIQEYSLEIAPPNELVVRIVERTGVLNVPRAGRFELVDVAGVVIETSQTPVGGYPVAEAMVVKTKSPAFQAAAQSLRRMQPELAAQIVTASATTDQDVTFAMNTGVVIVWGSSEDSVRKSVLVSKMLSSLAGRSFSRIDVSSVQAPVFS